MALPLTQKQIKKLETFFNANGVFYFSKNGTVDDNFGSENITGGRVVNFEDLKDAILKVGKDKFRDYFGSDIIQKIRQLRKTRSIIKRNES